MSLVAGFHRSLARNPGKQAVICGERSWTYAQFDRVSDLVAGHLLAAGIRPGDRVAFHLLNVPELALGYLGCLKAGAIAVPVNTRLKGPEIEYILRHSQAACYISQPELHSEVVGFHKNLPDVRQSYLAGGGLPPDGVRPFAELLEETPGPVVLPATVAAQTAAILYTSGTTAHPKGVTHSHATLVHTAHAMRRMQLDEHQIVLIISSMAHMVGFGMLFLASLVNGATVVLVPRIDALSVLQELERHRCTYLFGLPVLFHSLAEAQRRTPHDVSSGRHYFCGGDSVSPTLQEAFEQTMGRGVCEAYGGTEAVPLTYNRPGLARVGSIGQTAEGVSIRLLDGEDRDVKPGEVGEVCIQGPVHMTGYWKDPEATVTANRGGWFHTGDLASCDAEGYYWFAGRTKEIIIRGGSNISPQEVEAVLLEHPDVCEAAVIGRPDPVWGEIVVAYVVRQSGKNLTGETLLEFAHPRMAAYKLPEDVIFVDALPKGPTGKLNRRALRETERASASAVVI